MTGGEESRDLGERRRERTRRGWSGGGEQIGRRWVSKWTWGDRPAKDKVAQAVYMGVIVISAHGLLETL